MSEFDLIIKGHLICPDREIPEGYIAIRDGQIVSVSETLPGAAPEMKHFGNHWIFPGVIDGQTHTGSQVGQEGLEMGTRAAAAGGVTTIVDMPYDDPQPVVSAELFKQKVALAEAESHVDVALYGTIRKTGGLDEILPMVEAGACAFKFSTYESHPERFPRIEPAEMYAAMKIIAGTGLAVGVHNENQNIVDSLSAQVKAQGLKGPETHSFSRPPVAETLAISEIYELGAMAGCRAHVVHCSVGRGFDLCNAYKQMGNRTSIETCVHYMILNDQDVERLGPLAKVNPPIRPQEEVEKLWAHAAAGDIDFVSSDHVSWGLERKSNPDFGANASGVPGLETLLLTLLTETRKRQLPLTLVAKLLSEGPARHFCLYPRKGAIANGFDADLAIVEKDPRRFSAHQTQCAVDWSPYHDCLFDGRVVTTFVRGQQVWDNGVVTVEPGFGSFIRPVSADAFQQETQV